MDFGILGNICHLWGLNTLRTVKGGESFRKENHLSTNCGCLLNKVNLVSPICYIKCSLYPCNSTTNHKCLFIKRYLSRDKSHILFHAPHCSLNHLYSLLCCLLRHILVWPGNLLPYIGDLNPVWIEPCPCCCIPECPFMQGWGAVCNNNSVKLVFLYCVLNKFLTRLRTHVNIVVRKNYSRYLFCLFGNLFNINHTSNIESTVAYENTYPHNLSPAFLKIFSGFIALYSKP